MKLDMDLLRDQTIKHVNSLWQQQYMGGGFKESPDSYVSIMGTTDAAWIFYLLQAEDEIKKYGADACKWLLYQQKPDGHFYHDTPPYGASGYRHSEGHAYWMSVRALHIYGGDLPAFPAYMEDRRTPEGLAAWFSQSDWQTPDSNHHNVLSLIPTLVSNHDTDWENEFYRNLAAQQDLTVYTWCDNRDHKTNVSRTFAYCAMFMAGGRIPPHAREAVNTILKIQRDSGIWESRVDFPEYHTMDAVYILWRMGNAIQYPLQPRLDALNKAADAMIVRLASHPIREYGHLHLLLANLHTLGLLQEALPERFKTDIPWRFDWDKADMFYCKAIENYYKKKR